MLRGRAFLLIGQDFCDCHYTSKTAHYSALFHYKILLKDEITNRELRDFLLIDSWRVANHILIGLNVPYSGTNRWRVYSLEKFKLKNHDKSLLLSRKEL